MKNGKNILVLIQGIYKIRYHNDGCYCYLQRENYKVLKFHMSSFSYFEVSASPF